MPPKCSLVVVALLAACSKPPVPQEPVHADTTERHPRAQTTSALADPRQHEELPALPPALSAYRERVRALAASTCEAPADGSMAGVNAWMQARFFPWFGDKVGQVGALEAELKAAGGEANSAVVPGLLAYLQEDLAGDLLSLPVPTDIARDAELTSIYRNTLHEKAAPALDVARSSYATCTERAQASGAPLVSWAGFCSARGQRLQSLATSTPRPAAGADPGLPAGYGVIGVLKEDAGATGGGAK